MAFPANPFKPTAGVMPPVLIGRDHVSLDFSEALEDGPGAPDRLMIITGPRGCGKTVMLTELGSIAKQHHWDVVDETASEGLCDRLIARIAPDPSAISGASFRPTAFGFSLGEINIAPELRPLTLRDAMHARLNKLGKNRGLLVTIDETQDADQSDITAIATAAQHMFRDNGALDLATKATNGYPYMIQLVGYHIWREARRRADNTDNTISRTDVIRGIEHARAKLGEGVCAPIVSAISGRTLDYLHAMAEDDGPSATSHIAQRLGESMDYANNYRSRLIAEHIIKAVGRGKVDFAVPFLREYLRQMPDRNGIALR